MGGKLLGDGNPQVTTQADVISFPHDKSTVKLKIFPLFRLQKGNEILPICIDCNFNELDTVKLKDFNIQRKTQLIAPSSEIDKRVQDKVKSSVGGIFLIHFIP